MVSKMKMDWNRFAQFVSVDLVNCFLVYPGILRSCKLNSPTQYFRLSPISQLQEILVVEVSAPNPPASEEVLIEVKAAGINFYDVYTYQGLSPYVRPPCVLGLECSGVVLQIGGGVSSVKVGDRVVAHFPEGGAFAEQVICKEDSVLVIPAEVSFETAACLTVNYLTAYFVLFHIGRLRDGDAVFIDGAAGGVGWAATQLANTTKNITVFGTASEQKHDAIRENGVDEPLHYSENYVDNVHEKRTLGVTLYIDSSSGKDLTNIFDCLEPLGKAVVIGAKSMIGGEKRDFRKLLSIWWNTKGISLKNLITRNVCVAGFHLNTFKTSDPNTFKKAWKEILDMAKSCIIKPKIDSTWNFTDAPKALQVLVERKNIGKVILQP